MIIPSDGEGVGRTDTSVPSLETINSCFISRGNFGTTTLSFKSVPYGIHPKEIGNVLAKNIHVKKKVPCRIFIKVKPPNVHIQWIFKLWNILC